MVCLFEMRNISWQYLHKFVEYSPEMRGEQGFPSCTMLLWYLIYHVSCILFNNMFIEQSIQIIIGDRTVDICDTECEFYTSLNAHKMLI